MSTITCKNCDHHFKGNFCPHCGQSANVEAIGVKYFLHDIPHSILHIDKGFGYTFKELLLRPGSTLRNYLDGKRVKHFRPFAYVLIMATIYILGSKGLTGLTEWLAKKNGFTVNFNEGGFFEKYISLFFFIMIPIASLVTWLVLRKDKYNYWEHFLVNTYLTAQLSILFLLIRLYSCIKILVLQQDSGTALIWFITAFMFYIAFVFKALVAKKGERLKYFIEFILLCFLLALVYLTGMSLTGMMTPWWGK
jgi:Protein of unknown function (DUF3667)